MSQAEPRPCAYFSVCLSAVVLPEQSGCHFLLHIQCFCFLIDPAYFLQCFSGGLLHFDYSQARFLNMKPRVPKI
jgi:hypothetical protein